jgi:alpha-beta hydrolase superfamily lysophospholipase
MVTGLQIALTPSFSVGRLVWLERGGVLAVANLRGSGEYGTAWHEAGTKERKQNVFDDFIACAEHLIAEGVTTSKKLAIQGGSNGGLLVGSCMTQRPELFGACLPAVGVLDMLRFHQFTYRLGVDLGLRLGGRRRRVRRALRLLAAAQSAGNLLSADVCDHRRLRRPRGPGALVQVRRRAPGCTDVRCARARPRSDQGWTRAREADEDTH